MKKARRPDAPRHVPPFPSRSASKLGRSKRLSAGEWVGSTTPYRHRRYRRNAWSEWLPMENLQPVVLAAPRSAYTFKIARLRRHTGCEARLRVSTERRHANSPTAAAPNNHRKSGSGTAALTLYNPSTAVQPSLSDPVKTLIP